MKCALTKTEAACWANSNYDDYDEFIEASVNVNRAFAIWQAAKRTAEAERNLPQGEHAKITSKLLQSIYAAEREAKEYYHAERAAFAELTGANTCDIADMVEANYARRMG